MPVKIAGFAQSLVQCLDFADAKPSELDKVLSTAAAPLTMEYVEPSIETPIIRSGAQFNHLIFVQHGTITPWTYPRSELKAPFLIGIHEFLGGSKRWVMTHSALTEAILVAIPVEVMAQIVEHIPNVQERMQHLLMLRLARFYWTSLATSGNTRSRVAAALVSRLALDEKDYGEDRTIAITQKELGRLTTLSRSAVADGLTKLTKSSAIRLGNGKAPRYSGNVLVPNVDRLKDYAFSEVRDSSLQASIPIHGTASVAGAMSAQRISRRAGTLTA